MKVQLSSLAMPCLILLCASADKPEWRKRQLTHRLVKLVDSLKEVALLDQETDPQRQLLDGLLKPLLVARYVTSPAHERVRQHIASTLTALGWAVDGDRTFEMRTPLGQMPFTNVVATHDPAAHRRLVLACHYDSIYGRDAFVAATDSAVPCAMLLHLAALMTRRYLDPLKERSDITLQLWFLDGEEAFVRWTRQDSIYGARHLAEEMQRSVYVAGNGASTTPLTELDRIDLFVLLDLLGAKRPTIANYIPGTYSEFRHLVSLEKRLEKKGFLEKIPRVFKLMKSWGAWGPPQMEDDHVPFLQRGVKVLHLIPHPFPSVWHEDSDNASIIDYPTVTNLGRILRLFVSEYLGLADAGVQDRRSEL